VKRCGPDIFVTERPQIKNFSHPQNCPGPVLSYKANKWFCFIRTHTRYVLYFLAVSEVCNFWQFLKQIRKQIASQLTNLSEKVKTLN
jgi:hypothetical protein